MTPWDKLRHELMAEVSAANERRWAKIVRELDAILWGTTNAAISPYDVPRVVVNVEAPAAQSPLASDSTPA